jgi:putative flippase GtrA
MTAALQNPERRAAAAPLRPVTVIGYALHAMRRLTHHLQGLPIYAAGSALALALDTGTLMLALRAGLPLVLAATAGFLAGMALVYLISIRFAFHTRRLTSTRQELLLFALIGVAGLLLTTVLLSLFVGLGVPVLMAKGGTAGVVFCFNYSLRKQLLFSRAPAVSRV